MKNAPAMYIRKWNFLSKRIINKIWCIWNLLRLKMFGCKLGDNCVIHGNLGLSLSPRGMVVIGKRFYMSNGMHINPLCGNSEGHIHVEDGGSLIIGILFRKVCLS